MPQQGYGTPPQQQQNFNQPQQGFNQPNPFENQGGGYANNSGFPPAPNFEQNDDLEEDLPF